LFQDAIKHQPSIIFFDEIDALAPTRSSRQNQIHSSIVSTLLSQMDGGEDLGMVLVIAATNRPEMLDPALRRPGRFDREVYFPDPDLDCRRRILATRRKFWEDCKQPECLENIASASQGLNASQVRAIADEAFMMALRRVRLEDNQLEVLVTESDLFGALSRLKPQISGTDSTSRVLLSEQVERIVQNLKEGSSESLCSKFLFRGENSRLAAECMMKHLQMQSTIIFFPECMQDSSYEARQ